ncbi:centromere protein N isoform X2 [Dendropsophus ebraccatus]|uniref:centromere protein N isoform X2 n=1 Tax=Dendropsophus ebraccatus TaxID=150705 RepID=UPI0038316EA5
MAPTPGSARKARRQSISIMDERLAEFIKRMILRMPLAEVMPTLKSWGFLAEKELESLALLRVKDSLAMEVVNLCESKKATIDHAADLDIVYTHANTKKKTWDVYQMSIQSDEMNLVDVSKLRVQFKKSVKSVLKNGLLLATGYSQIQEMELKSRCLESLKSIVFKQFSQPFQSYQSRSIPEKSYTPAIVDPKVTYEDIKEKERVHHVMLETFGDGPLPKLEFASYKLETSFKGEPGIANKIEPFRCLVKFSSPHLLESIRNLAPLGLSEVPISNLLTCIPHRGRNIFKISEKKQATSSQALN